ncbi:MAG TPA: hypothetical protein VKC60_05475 [Opitutaceae bacterium]|nr:hypothetical protein [Opitutaceae bacterium]
MLISLDVAGAERPPFHHEPMGVDNGCFVESVLLYDEFHQTFGGDAWARVLQWGAKEDEEIVAGHAVAVFELKDLLWAYDINFGFSRLGLNAAQRDDPEYVASLLVIKYPRVSPRYPLYRFDFPQTAPENLPQSLFAHEDRNYRAASLVASKLAAHRPVTIFEFSYVQDGVAKKSAACAFIFNGKLCVYFPEKGTYPFITQIKSVNNFKLLRACAQRVYPGASALMRL